MKLHFVASIGSSVAWLTRTALEIFKWLRCPCVTMGFDRFDYVVGDYCRVLWSDRQRSAMKLHVSPRVPASRAFMEWKTETGFHGMESTGFHGMTTGFHGDGLPWNGIGLPWNASRASIKWKHETLCASRALLYREALGSREISPRCTRWAWRVPRRGIKEFVAFEIDKRQTRCTIIHVAVDVFEFWIEYIPMELSQNSWMLWNQMFCSMLTMMVSNRKARQRY
jgi:hypothetical protein